MQTAVLVNTSARALRRDRDLVAAIRLAASGPSRVWTTESLSELAVAARQIVDSGARRVVLCGGDGTLMNGVTALSACGALPEVVVAPGGTVATVARNWGQRAGLLDTVRRATRDVPPLRTLQSPTLRVVGDGERVGFIFGTGLVARFFERYYAAGPGATPPRPVSLRASSWVPS